ncbi:MAG: putative molybdenum carrier protein [Chromatiales bacterium]|jgi:hypothetical protein
MLERIVSGGQTGVDRGALDAALGLGIPCGGWCPAGRRAEDGPIPLRYPLRETPEADYAARTERNVRDSDATLILLAGPLQGGTALTRRLARGLGRPCRVVDLDALPAAGEVRGWLGRAGVRVLNVAGPRESQRPGIQERARAYLEAVLAGEGGWGAA